MRRRRSTPNLRKDIEADVSWVHELKEDAALTFQGKLPAMTPGKRYPVRIQNNVPCIVDDNGKAWPVTTTFYLHRELDAKQQAIPTMRP